VADLNRGVDRAATLQGGKGGWGHTLVATREPEGDARGRPLMSNMSGHVLAGILGEERVFLSKKKHPGSGTQVTKRARVSNPATPFPRFLAGAFQQRYCDTIR
jgi:hypothetical protein